MMMTSRFDALGWEDFARAVESHPFATIVVLAVLVAWLNYESRK